MMIRDANLSDTQNVTSNIYYLAHVLLYKTGLVRTMVTGLYYNYFC